MTNDPQKKPVAQRALLDRARRYCALSEHCESGVRQKLVAWGATSDEMEPVVASLRADGYLDDRRYARAYAESKLLHQHWSRQKVLYQLRSKHIDSDAIAEAMTVVPDETYLQILADEAAKKLRSLGGSLTPDSRRRLEAFLASRGYTLSEINHVFTNNNIEQ